jgi:hypothetical protein
VCVHLAGVRSQRRLLRTDLHVPKRSKLLPAEERLVHEQQPVLLEQLPQPPLPLVGSPRECPRCSCDEKG